MTEAGPTRRSVLRLAGAGIAGGAAVVLDACGSSSSHTQTSSTVTTTPGPDVSILNQALDLEHMAIAAYTAAAPLLDGSARLAAQRFLAQEIAHAGELAGLVHQGGGLPVKPRSSYDLGKPSTPDQLLRLLDSIEQAQIAGYVQAIPVLSTGSTRAAIAAILGNDAQHSSILRIALGRDPVPSAFVRGGK